MGLRAPSCRLISHGKGRAFFLSLQDRSDEGRDSATPLSLGCSHGGTLLGSPQRGVPRFFAGATSFVLLCAVSVGLCEERVPESSRTTERVYRALGYATRQLELSPVATPEWGSLTRLGRGSAYRP